MQATIGGKSKQEKIHRNSKEQHVTRTRQSGKKDDWEWKIDRKKRRERRNNCGKEKQVSRIKNTISNRNRGAKAGWLLTKTKGDSRTQRDH